MKQILFSTGNDRKIQEARAAFRLFDIEVEVVQFEFDEIQSRESMQISVRKAEDAYKLAGQRLIVVADTSWSIPALKGFPGGYMKDVAEWFDSEDFLSLMARHADKSMLFRESIVYKDQHEVKVFSKEYRGVVADRPRGIKGNSLEKIAEFDSYTLSERQDAGETSHSPEDFVWYEFAEWYSSHR